MIQRLIGIAALTAITSPAFAAEAKWYADFDEAQKVAVAEGKDLLVDFTGSDWCGWCIKLDNEVFEHAEWQEGVAANYVLVALDYPRGEEAKAKVPNPERNRELQQTYGVTGFPTIMLMTSEGEVYGRTGYQAGGPAAYLEHMAELRAEGRKALKMSKRIQGAFEGAADDADKWKVWGSAVELLEGLSAGSPFAEGMAKIVRWGYETDAKNERGARLRSAAALLAVGLQEDEHIEFVEANDPRNEQGYLEMVAVARISRVRDDASARAAVAMVQKVNEFGFKDKELAFDLNFQIVRWGMGPLRDPEVARAHAQVCKELGTEDAEALKVLEQALAEKG